MNYNSDIIGHYLSKYKSAFTLAEVLITLAIIGVVAAMTIPTLVGKYKDAVIISKYKKAYSTLANAYSRAITEYGDPITWGIEDKAEFLKRLEPYLNVSEHCYDTTGCTSKGMMVSLSGEMMWQSLYNSPTIPKIRLSNGFSIVMPAAPKQTCVLEMLDSEGNASINTNHCASVYVVVTNNNSADSKNYYGKDIFNFDLTRQGVMPTGYKLTDDAVKKSCSKSISGGGNGDTCGTWILRYNNVNYLYE